MTTDSLVGRLRAAGCVFAEDEARVLRESADSAAALEAMTVRRIDGEPLEVVVGWVEFDGMRFAIEAGVFVPRRRSELLVREAAAVLTASDAAVELCAGVAAIAGALSARVPGAAVYAAELDPVAVRVARRNLRADRVFEGDMYEPLPPALRGALAVIVANAPYVPSADVALMPREAREHEPLATLDGGADGLDLQRRVIAGAPEWLAPGGTLLVETSEEQAGRTADLFTRAGLTPRIAHDDDLYGTVVVCS